MDRVKRVVFYQLKKEYRDNFILLGIGLLILLVGPYLFNYILSFASDEIYAGFLNDIPGYLQIEYTSIIGTIYFFFSIGTIIKNHRMYTQVGVTRKNQFLIEQVVGVLTALLFTIVGMILGYIKQIPVGNIVYWSFDSTELVSNNVLNYFVMIILMLLSARMAGNVIGILINKISHLKYWFLIAYLFMMFGGGVFGYLYGTQAWFRILVDFLNENSIQSNAIQFILFNGVFYILLRKHQSKAIKFV